MNGEISGGFVMLIGLATVFVGLILLIIICKLMSWFCITFLNSKKAPDAQPAVNTGVKTETIPNRQEFVAAVSAVFAEELGTDVSHIRIHSIKKL
jgi:Na+-transporting methylmalonyl-CoA/oxaloacetate decarboxylase gamma subunit